MRILITGVTGFIGRPLARRLARSGHSVCGLSTDPEAQVEGIADEDLALVDLRDAEALAAVVDRFEPRAVIHLGGLSHVGASWQRPGDYLRVNFEGTRHLLRAAKGCRMLFASSAEVYGAVPEDEQPIREDRPLDPRSPYAMTKACAERVARDHGALVVRSFNTIGPGQNSTFALPSFAAQLAAIGRREQDPEIRVGDLSPRRDFFHVEDAAHAFEILLDQGTAGETYNLASGEARSIADLLDRLREISGIAAEVVVDPERIRPIDLPLLCGDAGRLRALGWSPSRGVDAALADLWREAEGGEPDSSLAACSTSKE